MVAAQQAAAAAQAALAAQQENSLTLEAQLASLKDTTAKTVAEYQAGVEAERKAREERERKAREEADRRAREAEIGRASCRERVCQYVSISMVAVSLKNTKHTPNLHTFTIIILQHT